MTASVYYGAVQSIDASFWRGRSVLVTGHTGFKGAWLALWLERLGARVAGFALPPEIPIGTFQSFEPWGALDSRYGDLRDRAEFAKVVAEVQPEVLFHLGAQSIVRRGWREPTYTYDVNVVGSSNVLEAAKHCENLRAIVFVTSDKVYATSNSGLPFQEGSPLGGLDPYSASKAAAEFVVSAWRRSAPRIPIVAVRCGNVIGGGDTAEDRLMVDAWQAMRGAETLVLRNPESIRPWQFVLEPLWGYLEAARLLVEDPESCPPALNFGPPATREWSVKRVIDHAFKEAGAGRWIEQADEGAPSEATTLRLNPDLARQVLGWWSRIDLETAIRWTVEWWKVPREQSRLLGLQQIERYESLLR
jgi:CDP-glucose 4,6-dehydratase